MAKIKGPLLSDDAHGSIGKLLTYSHRKSGKQARIYNKPLVTPSAKQRGQRRLTEFLVAHWQNMSDADKATWATKAEASDLNITGYHYFLREAQRDLYTHHGLCAYWHCNEIIGGKVLDISGNAHHGTLKPSWPDNAPTLITSVKTKFSKGLLYDRVDEYVDTAHTAKLNISDAITIEGVIKTTGEEENQYIFCKGYKIFFKVSVKRLEIGIDIDGLKYANGLHHDYLLGVPYSVAAVYDKDDGTNKIHIYAKGTEIEYTLQDDTAGGAIETDESAINIGRREDALHFGGLIDEVCYYNRGMSAAEILTRYKSAIREVE